jgi:hypothetical protein
MGPYGSRGAWSGEEPFGERREGDWRRDERGRRRDDELRGGRREDWRFLSEPPGEDEWRGRGVYEREDRGPLQWLGEKIAGRRARGPKGYRRSDDRIRDDVCERIARSGIDADDVEVSVENAEVTLTGTVRVRHEKWRLEDLADDVFGVEDVHNHLRMGRREDTESRADDDTGRMRH